MSKAEIISKLDQFFGNKANEELRKRSKYTREGVHHWLTIPERNSKRLTQFALELIEEEEAAIQARLKVRESRLKTA